MNVRHVVRIVALAAFFAGMTSSTNAARAAGFWIYLDCHGVNDLPDWAHTPNTITTSVEINGDWLDVDSRSISANACSVDNGVAISYLAFDGFEVDRVRFRSNGSNAFWLDKFLLVDRNTFRIWQWGSNDNFGWCVSTDPTDGNTPYCNGSWAGSWVFHK